MSVPMGPKSVRPFRPYRVHGRGGPKSPAKPKQLWFFVGGQWRRLALLVAASCLLATAAGCQSGSSADLIAYRTSLHALDEALYQQHAALIGDAVKAGIRTPADQAVVTAEIAQAERQYQHSGTTKPAN